MLNKNLYIKQANTYKCCAIIVVGYRLYPTHNLFLNSLIYQMKTMQEVRTEVQSEGIQSIYKQYKVGTPHSVMLRVIFNMLRAQANKTNADEREILNYQQAVFEMASEEEIKNFPSY